MNTLLNIEIEKMITLARYEEAREIVNGQPILANGYKVIAEKLEAALRRV